CKVRTAHGLGRDWSKRIAAIASAIFSIWGMQYFIAITSFLEWKLLVPDSFKNPEAPKSRAPRSCSVFIHCIRRDRLPMRVRNVRSADRLQQGIVEANRRTCFRNLVDSRLLIRHDSSPPSYDGVSRPRNSCGARGAGNCRSGLPR